MPRVSAQRMFVSHYPNARLERHRTTGRETYFLVRIGREFMWAGNGDTPTQAWRDACERKGVTALKAEE